ncbi:RNA polymerase II transcription factor B 52 kDa subunit [Coccidioides posadasii str. Silveira]|uniref:RNA polymerase II transcription factor B subunit 2 n=3 Tax=Coccidioides posadasii TaxID=199306 RepID=E9D6W9_COCPS|nr:Transcription factor tfb2 family protein [Coccidioides posadasii C735 delta SOWgp]EER28366.1 Transcription factor tfb2 family protein [Coccidioides posadasii C735 delta SOWgp]EFW17991.1 TFIIH and nucleotide excision repair factor 3 complexes subunit [Coccidioides posadasii str. Silveira]KMM68678.1 RNA polymerase II transcription factor B subunit 2 [Coccidioides posadasii RMSCC 3488]QVM10037.1 RNA polymerase II transcription factor B 52 kDa subunit [Coccidioides posadasii str. Silveira]|eukprot:XP_003070511.1 Transcription factor tfb2 family protein [Coccidioides posadasii C735 delta SOWgp]
MPVSSSRPLEYLESLPGTVFLKLYQQPSTALAIFRRMLPHLAKCFVMALLYLKDPLPAAELELWVKAGSKRERDNALSILSRLHILSSTTTSDHVRAYMVTNPFSSSLRQALTGGDKQHSFGVMSSMPDPHPMTVSDLDDYARRQWEGVLGYMVGTNSLGIQRENVTLSKGVKSLLQACHLVEVRDRRVEITKEGFAFVLQDVNTQVWHILILYVENAEAIGMDSVEVLSFLFLLSSLELGQSYDKKHLTSTQLRTLADLTDFGIVYQHSPASESTRFYPTRLATTLTSDSMALSSPISGNLAPAGPNINAATGAPGTGFIIIETNYRLYAYTSSPLQISLIALFTTLKYRFPNLVTGKLTRQSIRRAVEMGITADQIISYLTTHAHPQMRKVNASKSTSTTAGLPASVLPPTVVDQIRLWQLERDRLKATPGFLFKDFASSAEFEAPCRYAEEIGVLVWKSEKRRMFFVTRHEQVAAFLRSRASRS